MENSTSSENSGKPVNEKSYSKPQKIGNYEILGKIGQGSIAIVYLARHIFLPRVVALKVLKEDVPQACVRRFIQEAEVMSRLDHPNIVKLYDAGQDNGLYFMAVEYVDGGTLSQSIIEHRLSEKDILRLVIDIAKALSHIHNRGIVHRDLKPANILLDGWGRPKICDFSISKVTSNPIKLTKRGHAIGTSYYMPPEQVKGELDAIDARSDLYSLGVILFQSLTGRLPFSGSSDEVFTKIQNESPPNPRTYNPDISEEVSTLVTKAMDKDQDNRYQRSDDFVCDLESLLQQKSGFSRYSKRFIASVAFSLILVVVLVIREISFIKTKSRICLTLAQIEEHLCLGNFSKADEEIKKGLKLVPNDYLIKLQEAKLNEAVGWIKEAINILLEINRLYPDRPAVLYHLARLHAIQKDTDKVIFYLGLLIKNDEILYDKFFTLEGGKAFEYLKDAKKYPKFQELFLKKDKN